LRATALAHFIMGEREASFLDVYSAGAGAGALRTALDFHHLCWAYCRRAADDNVELDAWAHTV